MSSPKPQEEERALAGQRSCDLLVMISDAGAPETLVSVARIRARSINLSAGLIDATTAQSPQSWRELIASAGSKRAEGPAGSTTRLRMRG